MATQTFMRCLLCVGLVQALEAKMSNSQGTPVKGQTNTPNDKLNARQWVQVREVSGGTVGLSALADRGTYEG